MVGVGLDESRFGKVHLSSSKKENLNILYIGKIEERRNTLFILEIMKRIKELNLQIKLTLIGDGKEKYLNKCQKFIDCYHLNNIEWIRKVDNSKTIDYYLNSDVFILPTSYEIFGMVLLETLFFGTPFISTKNGGSTTLANEINGKVILDFHVDEWIAAIMELANKNSLIEKEKRHNYIKNSYTRDSLSNTFISFYKMILERENCI